MFTTLKTFRLSFGAILSFVLMIYLSSCVSYQFVTLDSNLPKTESQEFLFENDTISVFYTFAGENCPITLNIFNNLSTPIFIDWERSAIVYDDQSFSLGSGMEGDMSGLYGGGNSNIGLVAPKSHIKVTPMSLVNEFLPMGQSDSIQKINFRSAEGQYIIKKHIFDQAQSPLYFRCFLSYSESSDLKKTNFVDNAFWASEVFKQYSKESYGFGNQYVVSKATGFATVSSAVLLTGLVVYGLSQPVDDQYVDEE